MGVFDNLLRETISVGAVLCLPVLLAATLVGTLVAIAQAATQIQEQTLTLLPKIVAVALVFIAFGGFGFKLCATLFDDALASAPAIVRSSP